MGDEEEKELRVRKIKDGTVIDHIPAGYALAVLRILGITGREGNVISIAINAPSQKLVRKDIVKVEGKELKQREVDKIALVAPRATINIIKDYNVYEKQRVKLPETIVNVVQCANPSCVSKSSEPLKPIFHVINEEPLQIQCHFCRRIMEREDIVKQF